MRELVFYHVYLFIKKVGNSMQVDIMGSKKLPSLIENIVSMISEEH
jgi:hypothetical protein